MKMIGVCADLRRERMSSAVSRPSMPGMFTSSRITAHSLSRSQRKASTPDEAVTMFCSSSSRMVRNTTRLSSRSSTMRMFDRSSGVAALASSRGATTGICAFIDTSALQPRLEHREQLLAVHGLGQIVPGPGLDAALAVALHGLRGHRYDRQVLAARETADLARRFQ